MKIMQHCWCRASPESIILAQMAALQRANLHDACKYMLFPGARPGSQLPKLMHSFMQGPSQLLINHTEVGIGIFPFSSLLLDPPVTHYFPVSRATFRMVATCCDQLDVAFRAFQRTVFLKGLP